ncbi:MAG: TlpA disulfide reductase family protein [Myxococcales bacterium]|nr:TlpA family protein disulfide reductase [Polyangiaceae bacterium]MDW8247823.1 TlpA disulfide reductase family protein [Myxococcales bacterium]
MNFVLPSKGRRQVLLAAVVSIWGCGSHPLPPSSPSPLLGKPAPTFRRVALDGSTIDTAAFQGKTVVLKLFARYCEPCKRTLPAIQELHRRKPAIVFLGISEDDSEEEARQMVAAFGLTFPVVHDQDNVLAGRLRLSEMPATFLIDRQGILRWYGDASRSKQQLIEAIEAIDREPYFALATRTKHGKQPGSPLVESSAASTTQPTSIFWNIPQMILKTSSTTRTNPTGASICFPQIMQLLVADFTLTLSQSQQDTGYS